MTQTDITVPSWGDRLPFGVWEPCHPMSLICHVLPPIVFLGLPLAQPLMLGFSLLTLIVWSQRIGSLWPLLKSSSLELWKYIPAPLRLPGSSPTPVVRTRVLRGNGSHLSLLSSSVVCAHLTYPLRYMPTSSAI